ncbi:biotin synthase [Geranomyces variabilis]|uniref:biotin synthase n=1 Tax=Geranomyces variabilis TaxID=109894 RepID=A0AAD5XQE9_9FUNG|nr:biotin synthase [Geranomyces variabilis]
MTSIVRCSLARRVGAASRITTTAALSSSRTLLVAAPSRSLATIDTTKSAASASSQQPIASSSPLPTPTPPLPPSSAEQHAVGQVRTDWTKAEVQSIFDSPLLELLFHAARVHRMHHDPRKVQQCTLLSIKTGGCSEDCSYCPQSSRYSTGVKAQKLLKEDVVLEAARKARDAGSSRFCMGAAWRDLHGRKTNFNTILNYVSEIRGMGMEVCCTLGMLTPTQAAQLKAAGLTAYNHNLDTSREHYPKVITTRSYDDRLETIAAVRDAGISVCSGGIIGLGESVTDRVSLLHTLATLPSHPESVPVNALLAVPGTPLEASAPVDVWEMVRMISTARIIMPTAMIRLSAGRVKFSVPEQALCFMAGANSIFTGDKLLTTPNNTFSEDQQMFETLGLTPKDANFKQGRQVDEMAFLGEDLDKPAPPVTKKGEFVIEG